LFNIAFLNVKFKITEITSSNQDTTGIRAQAKDSKHSSISSLLTRFSILNVLAVKIYGEAEFWLSGGKVILIFIVFSFTFITMVGGNPQHDAYGFRYWKNPGAFAEHRTQGTLGRFEGFCAALWSASFCIVGPEYISMVSAEAKRPRTYIKTAFKTVYWRFGIFFIMGALAAGIIIPYNDPTLVGITSGDQAGGGTAAASPYVIAMVNMGISGLPSLVNALLVTSIFSAGNTYTYCATRSLYGLALEGRAPKQLRHCTKSGVPIFCYAIVMIFPCLSFLQVGSGSSVVLGWLINLITAGGIINYIVMTVTYIFFYRAMKAQGISRDTLPYKGWFQPYSVSPTTQNTFPHINLTPALIHISTGIHWTRLDDHDRRLLRLYRLRAMVRPGLLHLLHHGHRGPCVIHLLETAKENEDRQAYGR